MAAIVQLSRPHSSNRRGRVRQKIHVPAYATFSADSESMLDLYEVLDISERGIALQCALPIEVDQKMDVCLDLAETSTRISATARVAWFDPAGRVGLSLPVLPDSDARLLQEWLFLNAVAAAANADPLSRAAISAAPRQNYSDLLSAASAVQRETESLGSDLDAILSLIASRSRSLLRASGAAIALEQIESEKNIGTEAAERGRSMICRASTGSSAPPVGLRLQVGSGFSGECVRSGKLLRCDDTETDERVDLQSCRALGIRSILAAPARLNQQVIGLLEIFSASPKAFHDNDGEVLQRFADTVAAGVGRSTDFQYASAKSTPPVNFYSSPGSILFANAPAEPTEQEPSDRESVGGIRLPKAHLYLLMFTAATVSLALGYLSKPWIQETLKAHGRNGTNTVLASSKSPGDAPPSTDVNLSSDAANLPQLRELANRGNAAAENAMGLVYSAGDEKQGIQRDEYEAAHWFTKAAENGSIPAQSKLGSLYWSGRGVQKDNNRAYYWTVLARASGDDASKALAPFIAVRLTDEQRTIIEQQAEQWLQQNESRTQAAR